MPRPRIVTRGFRWALLCASHGSDQLTSSSLVFSGQQLTEFPFLEQCIVDGILEVNTSSLLASAVSFVAKHRSTSSAALGCNFMHEREFLHVCSCMSMTHTHCSG